MEELNLNYGISKGQKLYNTIMSAAFIAYSFFIVTKEYLANSYGILFIGGIIVLIFAIVLLLKNTLWLPSSILIINNESIITNMPGKRAQKIEWVSVSSVNIGPGYVVFLVNGGQKQRKVSFSDLRYEDVKTVKGKVIELCEHKNIPYHND
jgi:hypothetical protein